MSHSARGIAPPPHELDPGFLGIWEAVPVTEWAPHSSTAIGASRQGVIFQNHDPTQPAGFDVREDRASSLTNRHCARSKKAGPDLASRIAPLS